MLVEQWIEHLNERAFELDLLKPEHHFAFNQALFCLMRAPALNGVFSGAQLMRSASSPNQGYITLPACRDPMDNLLDIRDDAARIDAAFPMYRQDYYEFPVHHWGANYEQKEDGYPAKGTPLLPVAKQLVHALRQHDPYYKRLLDPEKPDVDIQYALVVMDEHLTRPLADIKGVDRVVTEKYTTHDWPIAWAGMSMNSYQDLKEIWGHRYLAHYNRYQADLVVAHTASGGVVGMMELCSHEGKNLRHQHTMSFVSVTPAYRGLGIATQMLDIALNFSRQQEKALWRTRPSRIGESILFDRYSELARTHHPDVPFVEPGLADFAKITLAFIDRNYADASIPHKLRAMNASLALARDHLDYKRSALICPHASEHRKRGEDSFIRDVERTLGDILKSESEVSAAHCSP